MAFLSTSTRSIIWSVSLIFAGCCTNVLFLEYIIQFDNGAGNLITFAQFLLLAFYGLTQHSTFRSPIRRGNEDSEGNDRGGSSFFPLRIPIVIKERTVPISGYMFLVLMFWSLSVINNKAFAYSIPIPFHIIFRSGSLIANLIIGWLYLGKTYSRMKVLSVVVVTAGIVMATLLNIPTKEDSVQELDYDIATWGTGVGLMVIALVLSAFLGCYQEKTYSVYGKNPGEMQFYLHFLALPFFFSPPILSDMMIHGSILMKSERIPGTPIPIQFVHLLGNVFTQFICINGVFSLLAQTSSLTLTLTISVRKFVSLVISILIFKNTFTFYHWMATLLVFLGLYLYAIPEADKAKEH